MWRSLLAATMVSTALAQPTAQCPAIQHAPDAVAKAVSASDIPVAHTPPGGYRDVFPAPILATCTEFLFWKALGVERVRTPVPAGHPIYAYVERIEQCGDRIVDAGGGTIADARADGTEANGVHDVSAFDFETKIHVIATYEQNVFVLRPAGIPWIAITRRLDGDGRMRWHRPDLGDMVVMLERIGGPCDLPPGKDWVR